MDRFAEKEVIYVAGYPKSGTTWLTRLVARALDSPSAGSFHTLDEDEPAAEGWDRNGEYVVRKGHYYFIDSNIENPLPHRISCRTQSKIIYIWRDPRALSVSLAHYQQIPIDHAITKMCTDSFGLPPWLEYMDKWKSWGGGVWVKYEDLVRDTAGELERVFSELGVSATDFWEAIIAESFDEKRKAIREGRTDMRGGRALNLALMRDGTTDGWRNEMIPELDYFCKMEWKQWIDE